MTIELNLCSSFKNIGNSNNSNYSKTKKSLISNENQSNQKNKKFEMDVSKSKNPCKLDMSKFQQ